MNKDEYIASLEKKVMEYEAIIADMSAPIIPSILPKTILVPITGQLIPERFDNITKKLLHYVHNNEIEFVIIDLTDITLEEIESICVVQLGREIHTLADSIRLMGVEPYFVGLSPQVIKEIISAGISLHAETHSTFKSALKHLMDHNGLVLQHS